MMSGLDEQMSDIPICPLCKGIPNFWILNANHPYNEEFYENTYWFWLFSNSHMKDREYKKRVELAAGPRSDATLMDVVSVECMPLRGLTHKFTCDAWVFKWVMEMAKQEYDGCVTERNENGLIVHRIDGNR